MPLSDMSPFKTVLGKRLLGGVALAALAVTLSACSDENKEAASSAPAIETTDTATKTVVNTGVTAATQSETKPVDTVTTASTATATTPATAEAGQTQMAQAAAPAGKVELPVSEGEVDVATLMAPGPLPEMALGEANAPVTIVEYMSMTCPHCAAFHNNTFDTIKTKYVDSGKVRFVLREFPFDPRAAAAFMLARCAPEGQYFPMVSMLFKQQEQWAAAPRWPRGPAADVQTGRFYTGELREPA